MKRQKLEGRTQLDPKKEKRLFCATCRSPVTHQDQRIPVQGGHEHRFTNPHNISYHIGCFAGARGCIVIGGETTEYTWFRGYAWRIALCAHCRAHLGWRFDSAAESFHGLILDRLISTPASRAGE